MDIFIFLFSCLGDLLDDDDDETIMHQLRQESKLF